MASNLANLAKIKSQAKRIKDQKAVIKSYSEDLKVLQSPILLSASDIRSMTVFLKAAKFGDTIHYRVTRLVSGLEIREYSFLIINNIKEQ